LDWIRQYVCRTEPERGGLLQQRANYCDFMRRCGGVRQFFFFFFENFDFFYSN